MQQDYRIPTVLRETHFWRYVPYFSRVVIVSRQLDREGVEADWAAHKEQEEKGIHLAEPILSSSG